MHRAFSVAVGVLMVTGAMNASAQQPAGQQPASVDAKRPAATKGAAPELLRSTSVFTTIHGTALDSTNGVLANYTVRLRDVRFGRIVDVTTTDKAGLFAFRAVQPGSYVVELVGNDQTILAASQILHVDADQAVSVIVKLPFRARPFGGLLGRTATSAAVVSAAAAAAGLLATEVTGANASSNGKPTIR